MKYLSVLCSVSLLVFGCAKISTVDVKSALVGNSYYLINPPKDSSQVEFFDTCSRHYNWSAFIVDEWEVKEDNGHVLLNYDTHDFAPKEVDGELEFLCEKTGQRLVRAKTLDFNIESLSGTWEDAHYAGTTPGMPLPRCANGQANIPGYTFKSGGGCTSQDFCESKKVTFTVNPNFKIITIGTPCSSFEQLRIRQLTPEKLVVDRQYEENGKLSYEFNKWFVKVKS